MPRQPTVRSTPNGPSWPPPQLWGRLQSEGSNSHNARGGSGEIVGTRLLVARRVRLQAGSSSSRKGWPWLLLPDAPSPAAAAAERDRSRERQRAGTQAPAGQLMPRYNRYPLRDARAMAPLLALLKQGPVFRRLAAHRLTRPRRGAGTHTRSPPGSTPRHHRDEARRAATGATSVPLWHVSELQGEDCLPLELHGCLVPSSVCSCPVQPRWRHLDAGGTWVGGPGGVHTRACAKCHMARRLQRAELLFGGWRLRPAANRAPAAYTPVQMRQRGLVVAAPPQNIATSHHEHDCRDRAAFQS